MLDQIATGLKTHFPAKLVDELLSAYQQATGIFKLTKLGRREVENRNLHNID